MGPKMMQYAPTKRTRTPTNPIGGCSSAVLFHSPILPHAQASRQRKGETRTAAVGRLIVVLAVAQFALRVLGEYAIRSRAATQVS